MSVLSRAPSHITAISPYQPGKPISELAREMGLREAEIIKLASNENPLGMSPAAKDAVRLALDEAFLYPDGNGFELKATLSARLGVSASQLVLGNGSNDILEMVARALLGPQAAAMYAQYAFAVYPLATQAAGARHIPVPAKDYGHDLEAMLAAITPETRVIFVANPNNPTGTFLPGAELEQFIARVPEDVLVVLDEAYTDYLDEADRYDSVGWIARFPNLLVTRTFSKVFGLAGLRVGYGVSSAAVIDLLNRVRQPFNVSSLALEAARAALGDEEFVLRSAELNRRGLLQFEEAFARLGLEYVPSWGNFVLVKVGDAAAINQRLLQAGVIVRPVAGYGLPEWLRITVGLPEHNQRCIEALEQALKA